MLYSVVVTAAEVARFCKEMFLEKYFCKKFYIGDSNSGPLDYQSRDLFITTQLLNAEEQT